jgi:S1-C subfamily serine protease
MLDAMLRARRATWRLAVALCAFAARPLAAQELPHVKGTRPVVVQGLTSDVHNEDLLGLGRTKFQGFIASELASVGYHVWRMSQEPGEREQGPAPLTLVGIVKEELCDEQTPRQCRIAVQWELQDHKGVVAYRTLTRAVDQSAAQARQARELVSGALRSLLLRPRFALQLTDSAEAPRPITEPLGFERCSRAEVALPGGARAAAAAYVLVESGSRLAGGAIISPDGLILTEASALDPPAPLFVRLSAQQKLPAEVLTLAQRADVALLHVSGHFDATCLPLRSAPLATGAPLFGVSSPLSEERATSLSGSVVLDVQLRGGLGLVRTDPRIAQAEGAPLFDEAGRLAAIVSGRLLTQDGGTKAQAIDVSSALGALRIEPAAITDPRLLRTPGLSGNVDVHYVRDADDPPFVLTQRYTYGTSGSAHALRRASLWAAGIGALGVMGTWTSFRTSGDLSSSAHSRLVVLNDLSWGLTALGAVGFGVSFALPEAHEVVDVRVQSGQRPRFQLALAPRGVVLSGAL